MNWLWWVGGGSAVVLLVVAALYFLGLGGVLKVIRSVLGALGDAAAAVRDWLREPGNKTLGLCGAFALLFLAAGLQSWQRGTVIVQQRADYTALKDKTDTERAGFGRERKAWQLDIAKRDATIAQFTAMAERQKQLLAQAQAESAAAAAAAEAARRLAAESEAKYQAAFEQRPPECKVALEVMAKACPTLTDY